MKFNFINFLGIAIVVIMLIPNIFYAVRFRKMENKCVNRVMNVIEQIGRYASFFLMFLPLGIWEFGFQNVASFLFYLYGNALLLLAYLLVWIFYFRRQSMPKALALAILPTCIFFLSGVTLQHWLLVISSVIFGTGHLYVTYQNNN